MKNEARVAELSALLRRVARWWQRTHPPARPVSGTWVCDLPSPEGMGIRWGIDRFKHFTWRDRAKFFGSCIPKTNTVDLESLVPYIYIYIYWFAWDALGMLM